MLSGSASATKANGVSWFVENRLVLRRRLPWLLALPLMVAGSFAAHVVGSTVAPAMAQAADGDGGELTGLHERASSGYAGHAVIWIGLVLALVAVIGIRGLVA